MPDDNRIAGTRLNPRFLEDGRRPPDDMFRWHARCDREYEGVGGSDGVGLVMQLLAKKRK